MHGLQLLLELLYFRACCRQALTSVIDICLSCLEPVQRVLQCRFQLLALLKQVLVVRACAAGLLKLSLER